MFYAKMKLLALLAAAAVSQLVGAASVNKTLSYPVGEEPTFIYFFWQVTKTEPLSEVIVLLHIDYNYADGTARPNFKQPYNKPISAVVRWRYEESRTLVDRVISDSTDFGTSDPSKYPEGAVVVGFDVKGTVFRTRDGRDLRISPASPRWVMSTKLSGVTSTTRGNLTMNFESLSGGALGIAPGQ